MAESFLTPKRRHSEVATGDVLVQSGPKSRRVDVRLKPGLWVTMKKPSSQRQRDKQKANTPCLVTALDGDTAKIMYPNQLTLFMKEHDDSVQIRCQTETCAVTNLRPCKEEDMPALDRMMVLVLCTALQDKPKTKSSGSQGLAGDKERFDRFTARIARVFKAAKREALDRKELELTLADTFSADEIAGGLAGLDSLNKILLQDDTVILI